MIKQEPVRKLFRSPSFVRLLQSQPCREQSVSSVRVQISSAFQL